MTAYEELVAGTDWAALRHRNGTGADLRQHLAGLLAEDADVAAEAVTRLHFDALCRTAVYPVTPVCVEWVLLALGDPRTAIDCVQAPPWSWAVRPLRALLLEWLGWAAEAAVDGNRGYGVSEGDVAQAVQACRSLLPLVYRRSLTFMADPDELVRRAALRVVWQALRTPELARSRWPVAVGLQHPVRQAARLDRMARALTIADWGIEPRELLMDEDPVVRATAALTPVLDGDPLALAEVRRALADWDLADWQVGEYLPQFPEHPRTALLDALLRRTTTVDAADAEALARATHRVAAQREWQPLLDRLFAEGYRPGAALSEAQRRFLKALVDNDNCWVPPDTKADCLVRAGLPDDRAALRALVAAEGTARA